MNYPRIFHDNDEVVYEVKDTDFNIQLSNLIKNNNYNVELHNLLFKDNASYKLLKSLLPLYNIIPYDNNQKSIIYSKSYIEEDKLIFNIFFNEVVSIIYPIGKYNINFNNQNIELEITTCDNNYFLFLNNIKSHILSCIDKSEIIISEDCYKDLHNFNNQELINDFNNSISEYVQNINLFDIILDYVDYNTIYNNLKNKLIKNNIVSININIIEVMNEFASKHIKNILTNYNYTENQINIYIEEFIKIRTTGILKESINLKSWKNYKINGTIINNYIKFNFNYDGLYLIKGIINL